MPTDCGDLTLPYLVEAGFEVKALAVRAQGPQVPVQGGFVPLRPPALAWRTTALEDVLQLLLARTTAEYGFTQGKLRSEAPAESRPGWGPAGGVRKGPVRSCQGASTDK